MEVTTSIDGNAGYFPSFDVLTSSKMESVGGNATAINSCVSSAQQEQNSFDAGLSDAQDALLSIIEQQSNRSPDEYRSALVPFGEILRDIYETSNQTLNLSQQQQQQQLHNEIPSTENFLQESANNTNQQQILPTNFHIPNQYQQQLHTQQHNQGFTANYNNTNLMNYLNPFNNSFNFYQNYQQQQSNSNYPTISSMANTQINNNENQIQRSKYEDYNQNIETLIETVYEDENDQNPVYLNFNVSQDGNAGTAAVVGNSNENHIPIQNTNYPVEQIIYPGIYPTQQQQTSLNNNNNNTLNGKLWYPESINANCNNNINENPINRNINQQNYLNNHQQEYRIQNNTNLPIRKLLHSSQSAFDVYHSRNSNKTPYQKYNKNKSYIDTTTANYHDTINNNYLIKTKNYHHHHHPYVNEQQQQQQQQFLPIGRNLQLQPNQKFITSDMISCRAPIQTKLTAAKAILNNKNQLQQQQPLPPPLLITPISTTSPSTTTTEACSSNGNISGDGVIIKELTNVDISGIDFSSLDTSDIVISKIEPKFGEPLHKKRKQDFKILDGSENVIFEIIDFRQMQQHQNDDINDNKLTSDQIDDIQIEKNLKSILNSLYTDDEPDDDNNNNNNLNSNNNKNNNDNNNINKNNNYELNIVKNHIPNQDEVPLSKLKVKKNKINKENLKLPSTSSSSPSSTQQQTITNNVPLKKQKRTLLKNTKIERCFDNHDDETSTSDTDFEDFILKNKSFKCHKCNKIFKSAKTLSTHRKRCNNITEDKILDQDDKIDNNNNNNSKKNDSQQQIKNIISSGCDSEHDDDPNSYPIEYLESDTEVNYIKNQNVSNIIDNKNNNCNNNEEQQQIVKETIEIDLENNEEYFRRKTRSQTKRKIVDLNYYEPSQKLPVKRKK